MDAFTHYEAKEIDEDSLPEYTLEEVARHNSPDDLWIVVYGKVYDVTEWQHDHPGGDDILNNNAGKDVSALFRSVGHSPDAMEIRPNFMVGRLVKHAKL
mmetsp:Transcript_2290/g.3334  ORF Transcript_2290/g.3334 Transcript_2290/m.3334 type:complete len:99 (+) Transcript_2290:84-380(+)